MAQGAVQPLLAMPGLESTASAVLNLFGHIGVQVGSFGGSRAMVARIREGGGQIGAAKGVLDDLLMAPLHVPTLCGVGRTGQG